jgi:hypothetical protein
MVGKHVLDVALVDSFKTNSCGGMASLLVVRPTIHRYIQCFHDDALKRRQDHFCIGIAIEIDERYTAPCGLNTDSI